MWSACLPHFKMNRVQIPLTSTIFIVQKLVENNEKEGGNVLFKYDNHSKQIL